MSSVSGLSPAHRSEARSIIAHGCAILLNHASVVHYTQGQARWEGINQHKLIAKGEFPRHGDCSSTATWLLWNALAHHFGVRDLVNDLDWHAGFTGTIAAHGKQVRRDEHIRIGDLILYGSAPNYEHVAVALGSGRAFSHGSEAGPFVVPLDYRPDRGPTRRFI